MTRLSHPSLSALFAIVLLLSACAQPLPETTPGSTRTPEPSVTPSPTPSPTPTFTPTPTAQPLVVSDNLRDNRLAAPIAQPGAPCGIVDMLDFPVGAPDGQGFAARWIFGRNSSRYNGIHAGEDWARSGGTSLGQPVYSIGHGTVTYAQPLGWGIDRGVVIVRHVFADGSTILSFYGHLDPPSVVLRPGDCVARGDQVGAIGKPRGSPHLHFEIRNHTPGEPGPGYWPVDPRLAGWYAPSEYIWNYRIETAPGVQWTRPFTSTDSVGFGLLNDGTLAAIDARQLISLDPLGNDVRWSYPISGTVNQAVVDADRSAVYLSTLGRSLQAIDAAGEALWQIEFDGPGRVALMPLPGGGVVAHVNERLVGISSEGRQLWQAEGVAPPYDWVLDGDRLIFTTNAEVPIVHMLDRAGDLHQTAQIGGRLAVTGGGVFIYNTNGVHRLEPERFRADLVLPLDAGFLADGHIMTLPDGGLIVSHRGRRDLRLIGVNVDGTLRWDRSVSDLTFHSPYPFLVGDQVYVLTAEGDVLWIDARDGTAQRVFDGGSGTQLTGDLWAFEIGESRVLFDFRGGQIIAFDPRVAIETTIEAR